MGLNAFFAFAVVGGMGHSWQVALGAVFVAGVLFLILSILPVREWIINSIPVTLKLAIAAGIGFFLAIIGLENAKIIVDHPATLVTLGDLTATPVVLSVIGFLGMVILSARKVPGAIVISILVVTAIGWALGISEFKGVFDTPPNPAPTFMQMDIVGALEIGMWAVVFTFLLVDLFDTAGTLVGVAHQGGLLDAQGRLPRLGKALISDSSATIVGAVMGTSNTTSYIESAAGIASGGRTGLTAVVVGILFLLCLFLAPLAQSIPGYATAPALIYVACLMVRGLAQVEWEDITEVAPVVMTAIAMPLTYSIADGIGIGFITYAVVKLLSGRHRDLNAAVAVISVLFVIKFVWL
jgi:AGZA family xanthine/uracil permease-like MFS transporter